MNISINNATHFGQQFLEDHPGSLDCNFNNNPVNSGMNCNSREGNEHEAFANILSTNLEDLMELADDRTKCEQTEEMKSEAMSLPLEQRVVRLKEIEQHERFLQTQEKRKKILSDKNHRPFDDSNIGLCSVCMDDNFQVVHQFGLDTACNECFCKIREI